PASDFVDAIIVITELRKLALNLIVDHKPGFIANDADFCISHCREAIGNDRHTRHAESHGPQGGIIMKRHFKTLISVLVVHVVNYVHGVDVDASEPSHHLLELVYHVIEVKVLAHYGNILRPHLLPCNFVPATVDGIQEALGQIRSRAEELHLLSQKHG